MSDIDPTTEDALRYIHEMLWQLRTMSSDQGADLLTFMIEMAYMEAGDIVEGQRPLKENSALRDEAA